MALVEVDETELLQSRNLRKTVEKLLANPEAKLRIQEAAKIVDPNAVTPELDAARAERTRLNPVMQELADMKKQLADEKAERENYTRLQQLNSSHEAGFDQLRRSRKYMEPAITEIRKIMEEKGILDHEIAANHFDALHPPQTPVTPGSGAWNFMDQAIGNDADADLKALIETRGENEQLLHKMAHGALAEVRAHR